MTTSATPTPPHHPSTICEHDLWQYLLDTTPLSAYLLGRPGAISLIDPWIDRHEAATSILVYGEPCEYLMSRPHLATRATALQRAYVEEIQAKPNLGRNVTRALPPYGCGSVIYAG